MARIPQISYEEASSVAKAAWDEQIATHGRMTNMKRTMAQSGTGLRVMMEWYPLRDEVAVFLGDRATTLFAHAVSAGTDCLICSTFFRRTLKDAGEDPDKPQLSSWEKTLVDFGRQLAKDAHGVSDALWDKVAAKLDDHQMVTLTIFAGMMIATNVFNNAVRVDLDDYLEPYQDLHKDGQMGLPE